ncbi:hypothetical protein [Rhodoferax sp.]|uniref:hypothetical protein n=1 Tax=Rhodoferax sp. TaxID=50421 RepID=UPI00374D7442
MPTAELTVHRLRLAPGGAQVSTAGLAARVEDALRVSSKPPALLHRQVWVRRLRLASAAGASAQSLALMLERAWQRIAAEARPLNDALASAEAVWATDVATARVALIARWAGGADTSAWFWQRIGGAARGRVWPQHAADLMLAPLDEDADAPPLVASAAVEATTVSRVHAALAVITGQGAAASFIAALDEARAAALWAHLVSPPTPGLVSAPVAAADTAHAASIVKASARSHLRAFLRADPAASLSYLARQDQGATTARPAATPLPIATASRGAARDTTVAAPAAPHGRAFPWVRPASFRQPSVAPAPRPEWLSSDWAGLWLLLPVLLRHGLDEADDPLAAFAQVLGAACACYAPAADDAVHLGIEALDLPGVEAAGDWLSVARLAAAREARLPLRSLLRRRGVAWVSWTRIDIDFPAAAVDVRIRRAGFDIDPGFVPWLGRIVHFHYG